MRTIKKQFRHSRGAALIISLIFVMIFSALAVSLASMSGANLQLANNQQKADRARACAESGIEITRFWVGQLALPNTTSTPTKFPSLVSFLQTNLTSNMTAGYDGSYTVTIPDVTLDSSAGKSFSAVIRRDEFDADKVQVTVTGRYGSVTRTIQVEYNFGPRAYPIFDYGVATKGPLHLSGNIDLEGTNLSVESSVYIESDVTVDTLSITGNSSIAGECFFSNPTPDVTLQGGQASIGGETGEDAINNHVHTGVDPVTFPSPNPGYFEQYIVNTIDSSTDTDAGATYENVTIVAGTNPHFTGNITLKGIVFIETPNIVTFGGNASITGIIIGDGDISDNTGDNQINFTGTVTSNPVTDLPEETQFAGIKQENGTFLLAPGFSTSFGGNFSTLNGVIAANGIEFSGDAGGTINGSVMNYSDTVMDLNGNANLSFNNNANVEIPSGFEYDIILNYDPDSYSEVII